MTRHDEFADVFGFKKDLRWKKPLECAVPFRDSVFGMRKLFVELCKESYT